MRRTYRVAPLVAIGLSLTTLAGTAQATPSHGVSAVELGRHTEGGTEYVLREITLQPGGSTGWHYHDGVLYGVVRQGTLTHYDATCATDGVYPAGAVLTEPDGSDRVHIGRNLGDEPVVLDVLYVDPAGSPLAQDAANPGCSFE